MDIYQKDFFECILKQKEIKIMAGEQLFVLFYFTHATISSLSLFLFICARLRGRATVAESALVELCLVCKIPVTVGSPMSIVQYACLLHPVSLYLSV